MGEPICPNKGFTLLEVLFILFLTLLLITQVAPRFVTSESYTRQKADSANRLRIEGAVEIYRVDTGRLPEKIGDLIQKPSGVAGWRGPYLDAIPENTIQDSEPYELDNKGKVKTP